MKFQFFLGVVFPPLMDWAAFWQYQDQPRDLVRARVDIGLADRKLPHSAADFSLFDEDFGGLWLWRNRCRVGDSQLCPAPNRLGF